MALEKEERILVSVRMRPLNAKEISRNDLSDWECVDNTTIVFKNSLPERPMYPASYTFDRVFGCECNTRKVYNEGAKQVVLSVVNGINASIFAYGQTSSGKTYTMAGITKYAVKDIYDYIKRHEEREFFLKFSAMEIYNEAVRDLLSCDSSPLRLLDDSEGGTVVEKLTEETLRDRNHLNELLSLCEAQRQVGETSLNELSSRSHQILRLTIESISKQFTGKGSSSTLLAAVNFVDLAGSERASQVSFGGARQKEGCHINRSLLTLGTVIRKLSKGRTGHIPFRDSKLTRILQPFLGGNGRTAIICTMSPARSHIEQSRNTLSFASCAKQVVTNAQVNAVMSDKALVRHLQRELTRLENEVRYRESETCTDQCDVIKDKDVQIQKMEREIGELMHQIDLAQSRHEYLLRAVADDQASRQWDELSQSEISHIHTESEDSLSISGVSGITYQIPEFDSESSGTPEERSIKTRIQFSNEMNRPWSSISSQTACEDSELCKEVQCIDSQRFSTRYSGEFNILMNENDYLLPLTDEDKLESPALLSLENINLVPAVEQPPEIVASTSDNLVKPCHDRLPELPWVQEIMNSRELVLNRSRSCKASLMNTSILSWLENVQEENKTRQCRHHNYSSEFPGEKPAWIEGKLENDMPLAGRSESCKSIPSIDVIKTEDAESVPLDVDTDLHSQRIPSMDEIKSDETKIGLLDADSDVHSQSIPSIDVIKTDDSESFPLDVDTDVDSQSIPSNDVVKTDDTESVPLDVDIDVDSQSIPSIDVIKTDDTESVPLDVDIGVDSQSIPSIDVIKTDDTESVPLDADTDVHNTSPGVNLVEEEQLHPTSDQDTQQTQLEEYEDEKVNEDEGRDGVQESSSPWPLEFERKQIEIIELWHACNVSLTHRTCFFLLFKGDQADAFYMEVECRKLAFLRNSFSHGNCVMAAEDSHGFSLASSSRNLRREREMLCREMKKKLPTAERKKLYAEWGIAVTSKQRRLQLAQLLWTRTDMEHVRSSASLVAKLIGFVDQGEGMKEMFSLSFAPQPAQKRSFRWCHGILSSLLTLTK